MRLAKGLWGAVKFLAVCGLVYLIDQQRDINETLINNINRLDTNVGYLVRELNEAGLRDARRPGAPDRTAK